MELLNITDQPIATAATPTLAQGLLDAARSAKGDVYFEEDSPERRAAGVERLRQLAAPLAELDLATLSDRATALAFWINVYNALVIHGALALGVRESMEEAPDFFKRASYRVGGLDFNLDIIEHGLLRENRGHPMRVLLPQLSPRDPRRALVVKPMDVRIHFALNCGAASCPPIRHYTAEGIEAQLAMAAQSFVTGGGVEVDEESGGVQLSKIFLWYARDFGLRRKRQLASALAYIDDPTQRQQLNAAAEKNGIQYKDYSWSIA